MRLTNTELSKRLGIPHSLIRRWAKEFLPPDPKATLRSGYTKTYSLNDGFKILIVAHLVSYLNFTVPEAKQILSDIDPWLRSEGLLPELEDYKPTAAARLSPEYVIEIMRSIEEFGFAYEVKGTVGSPKPISIEGVQGLEARQVYHTFGTVGTFVSSASRALKISDILQVFLLRTIGLEEISVWQAKRKG